MAIGIAGLRNWVCLHLIF